MTVVYYSSLVKLERRGGAYGACPLSTIKREGEGATKERFFFFDVFDIKNAYMYGCFFYVVQLEKKIEPNVLKLANR